MYLQLCSPCIKTPLNQPRLGKHALAKGIHVFWYPHASLRYAAAPQTGIYIGLGWAVLPYAGAVRAALGPGGAALLVAGGLAYSIGGIIYAMHWPDPYPRRAASAQDGF